MEIKELLEKLGYTLRPDTNGWRARRLYAEGDNDTALKIYKDGWCQDFVENTRFPLDTLIKKTLRLDSDKDVAIWKANNQYNLVLQAETLPPIKMKKTYNKESLTKLVPDYSYWTSRGISESTIKPYLGGISNTGGSKGRFAFPIFDSKNDLIGCAARDITNTKSNKWKLFGDKSTWVYPAFVNNKQIGSSKQVILVESIGDMLALNECGIMNVIVMFGTAISFAIINYIISHDANVIISTNNDSDFRDSTAGNEAAQKIKDKLLKYIDKHKVKIILPDKAKDFNEQLTSAGRESILCLYR